MTPLSDTVAPTPSAMCICGKHVCVIPFGKCHCGCGHETHIAGQNREYGTYRTVQGMPQAYLHGHFRRVTNLRPCPVPFVDEGYLRCLIPMTRGYFAKIDYCDLDKVWAVAWVAHKGARGNTYARGYLEQLGTGKCAFVYMHRLIMGVTDPKIEVDHIDGNATLNNTRENLQVADHGQQQCKAERPRGRAGFRGVMRENGKKESYRSYVDYRKVRYQCGAFPSAGDAARARDRLALRLQGEFATLNFPRSDYSELDVQSLHATEASGPVDK